MTLSLNASPGDTIHVEIRNVTHSSAGAITAGLTGTVIIQDASGATQAGPSSLANISGSTWGANITAPSSAGDYYVVVAFDASSAHRSIKGYLKLQS